MLTTTEAAEITSLTKKINSTWLSEEKKKALARIGLINFDTEEEFDEWRKYENDDLQLEKRIKNALYEL